ncbi:hypothetical protein E9229_000872 [Paeniglutamicibacter cryotolerans]|uniref:Uncharacterized protein n=1 Tax=Paeniglutamicibacter cryotolerans TaxID=670079 RepID=A0A839QRI6_9MICC|nr:hypothetical protein [Paeniglutamicibacter cryotolerans]
MAPLSWPPRSGRLVPAASAEIVEEHPQILRVALVRAMDE